MTNEKQDALSALDALRFLEEYPTNFDKPNAVYGYIQSCLKIRAALEREVVDLNGLKQRISDLLGEKLDGNILTCQEWAIKFTLDHLTTHYDLVKKEG